MATADASAHPDRKGLTRPAFQAVQRVAETTMAAVLVIALAAYCALGFFNRYVADDYGQVLAVRLRGFWGQQAAEYRLWSGRFTSTAVIGAAASLNEDFVRILPGVLLAVWVALLYWLCGRVVTHVARTGRLLLAGGIVFTTVAVTPSPFLSIYWMTGSLTYVVPLLLGTLLAALICGRANADCPRAALLVAIGVIALLAGGSNETYLAAQTVALAIALAGALSPWVAVFRRRVYALAAGLAGSLVALCVLVAAPGNAVRSAVVARVVHDRPSLPDLPGLTFTFARDYFQALFAGHWLSLLALALLVGIVGARAAPTGRRARALVTTVVAIVVAAFVVVTFAIAPSALAEARIPVDYAQIVLVYICVCASAAIGWLGGTGFRVLSRRVGQQRLTSERTRRIVVMSLIAVASAAVMTGPVVAVTGIVSALPAIESYANIKDVEAETALAAHGDGRSSAVVPRVSMVDNLGVFSHSAYDELLAPSYWINRDEAEYYGVSSLATSPPPAH